MASLIVYDFVMCTYFLIVVTNLRIHREYHGKHSGVNISVDSYAFPFSIRNFGFFAFFSIFSSAGCSKCFHFDFQSNFLIKAFQYLKKKNKKQTASQRIFPFQTYFYHLSSFVNCVNDFICNGWILLFEF